MEVVSIIMSFNRNRNRKKKRREPERRADSKNFVWTVEVQTGPAPFKCPMWGTITLIVITFLLLLGMHQNFMHFYLNIRVLAASSVRTLLSTVCSSFWSKVLKYSISLKYMAIEGISWKLFHRFLIPGRFVRICTSFYWAILYRNPCLWKGPL